MSDFLSVIGLYTMDNRLFAPMVLPEGVDKETVRDNILLETAELETLYADADFFKFALKIWSKKRLPTWQRIWDTLQIKYDPLENFRRTEQYGTTLEDTGENTRKHENHDTRTPQLDKTETVIPDETNIISKTGYNSNDWRTTEKNERNGTNVVNTEERGIENYDRNGEQHDENHNTRTHTGENMYYGKIGITSNQTLLRAELKIAETNMVEIIVSDFKDAFCVMVY